MNAHRSFAVVAMLGLLAFAAGPSLGQEQAAVSHEKLVGTWDVELAADGQAFYLTLVLTDNQGKLEGKISEQNGFFTDVPLTALTYDGQTFSFDFTSPTPPDGLDRLVQSAFKWTGDALEGTVTVPDLGMSIPAKAAKKV